MKKRVLKDWVIYLLGGILYGIVIVRASQYSCIDILLIIVTVSMMIVVGYWIQKKENDHAVRQAYIAGRMYDITHPENKRNNYGD